MSRRIAVLRKEPELLDAMAGWFPHTFGVPEEVYRQSMEQCLRGPGPVPQWYAAVEEGAIVGGLGVIANDFHDRPDLSPNVCAVYVDRPWRGRGIAGELLGHVCEDMAALGVSTLYLVTDHTSFYERYGWTFLCMVNGEDGPARMYRKETGQKEKEQA